MLDFLNLNHKLDFLVYDLVDDLRFQNETLTTVPKVIPAMAYVGKKFDGYPSITVKSFQ